MDGQKGIAAGALDRHVYTN